MNPERRIVPRYSYHTKVQVRGVRGEVFSAKSSDVSLTGICLTLSRTAVLALAQSGEFLTIGDQLQVFLPCIDPRRSVRDLAVPGRVRHVYRVSADAYQVGVWFADQSDAIERGLTEWLERLRNESQHQLPGLDREA